jgi:hypothetical protein
VVEDLAEPRPGWEKVLRDERENWRRVQLQAAVRSDPVTAREVLQGLPAAA